MNEQFADLRKNAPSIKRLLKHKGCEQKFYDYLDDYREEFKRIADKAREEHPSLLGVHEIDDADYYAEDRGGLLQKFGYAHLRQIFVKAMDVDQEYLEISRRGTITGSTIALRDEAGNVRTLVFIRKSIGQQAHPQMKYAFKIVALLHEIGHVTDWEEGINLREGEVKMIDAEVYAHEFALERLMEGDYRASLDTYLSGLEDLRKERGCQRTIAERLVQTPLVQRCRECVKTNWSDHLDASDLTAQELVGAMGSLSAFVRSGER